MQEVERFRKPTRWLHWIHAGVFLILVITGGFLWVQGLGPLAVGGWSRLIHRIIAVVSVGVPLIYLVINWQSSLATLKELFTWGREDLGWLFAAPAYYFLGDESKMPPQGEFNTGQKMFYVSVILSAPVFVITGAIMWFFKGMVPAAAFQWSVFAHDVAVIFIVTFFILHFYLSVLHPKMYESLQSMWTGKVSTKYAKSHFGKWYQRILEGKKA